MLDQLELSHLKLEQLLKYLGEDISDESATEGVKTVDFQEFVEAKLAPDNLRIKIQTKKSKKTGIFLESYCLICLVGDVDFSLRYFFDFFVGIFIIYLSVRSD